MKSIALKLSLIILFASAVNAASLNDADQLYGTRTETSGGSEALAAYEQAITSDANAVEPLWKAARACHWIADHAKIRKEKIAVFEKGIRYGEKAIAMDPRSVESHFWLGALYGSYGETKGVLKSLALVKPIRREMEAVNRLNERFQGGAGYRILGIVDYKVPGFAGGSKKRAKEQLNKALSIDPTNPFNQYYVAEFYATAINDKNQAREHLRTLRSLQPTEDVDAADLKSIQQRGARLETQIGT